MHYAWTEITYHNRFLLNYHPLNKPGMSDRSNCTTEFTVNASTVVKFFIGWPGRALIFDAADATYSHNQNDQHQDKCYAESPNYDVEGVTRHIC